MTRCSSTPYYRRRAYQMPQWLPDNSEMSRSWARDFVEDLDKKDGLLESNLWPEPVKDLDKLIESSPPLRMLASRMFDETPNKDPYKNDPTKYAQVRDYKHMLGLFAVIIKNIAPRWSMYEFDSGLIGCPFNAILDWPMATRSGFAFFLNTEVNQKLKVVLDTWRDDVLTTSKSQYVITSGKDGWLSKEALDAIESDTNIDGQQTLSFEELFKCDREKDPVHWGFKSWDDFFVKEFKDIDKLRPVAYKNDPSWIVSSCELRPYALQTNVKAHDSFWMKAQPYSVNEMLHGHPNARHFVGGTVFQAFLSPTSYHRWSSPVEGNVVSAFVVDGTYFSNPNFTGFKEGHSSDPNEGQGYMTHVATRAIFFIEAKPPVGLVCVIYVGMADVSTCEIGKKFQNNLPQPVAKGEETGMFHLGGSTYCLLFRKGVKLAWVSAAFPGMTTKNLPVRSELVQVYT
ncbi:hypothetical protein G7046_g5734 [Stylonectria norvegica]|nr:hypothetical protein G7046_g5734 [Stylonectria norvegica]